MPRNKPTTIITPRTKPSTEYASGRVGLCYSWDTFPYSWEGSDLTWEDICSGIETEYNRPRKVSSLQDELGAFFETEAGETIESEGGDGENRIQTIYT